MPQLVLLSLGPAYHWRLPCLCLSLSPCPSLWKLCEACCPHYAFLSSCLCVLDPGPHGLSHLLA